jgi:hypothetical protein
VRQFLAAVPTRMAVPFEPFRVRRESLVLLADVSFGRPDDRPDSDQAKVEFAGYVEGRNDFCGRNRFRYLPVSALIQDCETLPFIGRNVARSLAWWEGVQIGWPDFLQAGDVRVKL